jgi:hypothetical protein
MRHEDVAMSSNPRPSITQLLASCAGLLLAVTIRFALNVHWNLSHLSLASSALIALLLKVDILWVVVIGTVISVMVVSS